MNRTRWKLLIGTLGLSLGGLAAVADVPSQNGIVSCTPGKPQQVARVVYQEPPIPIPVPKVADVPMSGAPMIPAPAIIPAIPDLVLPAAATPAPIPFTPAPTPLLQVPVAPSLPPISLSEPVKPQFKEQVIEVTVPAVPIVGTDPRSTKPLDPLVQLEATPGTSFKKYGFITESGQVLLDPKRELAQAPVPALPEPVRPIPVPLTLPTPAIAPVVPIIIDRHPEIPKPAALVPAQPIFAQELPRIQPVEAPRPQSVPAVPANWDSPPQAVRPAETLTEPARNHEKKLKVLLHMGDERPRFEVKDGDDVYLKVISDKVEVKSPSDSGANMSTMRAGGKVTFITPGGEGTCDELSVIPGTGQVIVTGKVAFTYNWGKVETTVSGEKMTFRLGSTPGTTPSSGTQGVPTSYQRVR